MTVKITVTLSEREADALLKVEDRGGWHSPPSQVLQVADLKIIDAIQAARLVPQSPRIIKVNLYGEGWKLIRGAKESDERGKFRFDLPAETHVQFVGYTDTTGEEIIYPVKNIRLGAASPFLVFIADDGGVGFSWSDPGRVRESQRPTEGDPR